MWREERDSAPPFFSIPTLTQTHTHFVTYYYYPNTKAVLLVIRQGGYSFSKLFAVFPQCLWTDIWLCLLHYQGVFRQH